MSELITRDNFLQFFSGFSFNGFLAGMLTDEYIFTAVENGILEGGYSISDFADRALELRFFNKDEEIKFVRTAIDRDFILRHITPENENPEFMDEQQFLDIDTTKGIDADGKVSATGGGRYYMPEKLRKDIETLAVTVRSYFGKYPETGHARITDWRLTGAAAYKKQEKK